VKALKAHSGGVTDLEFSPRGDCFFSSGKGGKVTAWSFPDCGKMKTYSDHDGRAINSIALSPDGRYLATVGSDGKIVIRDTEKDEKVYSEPLPSSGTRDARYSRLTAVSFDAEAAKLAVGENKGRVEVVDLLNIPAIKRARALPCKLKTTVSFSDALCFYPNRLLDGGETRAEMVVNVTNKGEGPAFDVNVEIACSNPGITIVSSTPLGTIPSEGQQEVQLPVQVSLNVEDGSAIFTVDAKEKRKQDAPRQVLEIPVRHLDRPNYKIVKLLFNDGSGKAIGNNDGVPQNGETGELEVFITNTGVGSSIDTELSLVSISEGIQEHIGSFQLGKIKPQATKKGALLIEIPRDYASDRIDYSLSVLDGRGAASLEASETILMDRVSPSLAYEMELPKVIQNASSILISIIPKNLGRLKADEVEIQVTSPDGVDLSTPDFFVGKIGPGEVGKPLALTVDIPRTFNKETFYLEISMNQLEFPGIHKREAIGVKLVRPDLKISANFIGGHEGQVIKGEKTRIQVQVTNKGELAAEDVVLNTSSDNVYVIPSPARFQIGTIPAGEPASVQLLELEIPRGIEEDAVTLALSAEQRSFMSKDHILKIALKDAGSTYVELPPTSPPDVDDPDIGHPDIDLKPNINVQGLSDGETIYQGSVDLFVLASDAVGLKDVVISVGQRKIYDSSTDPKAKKQLGSNPRSLLVSPRISNLKPGQHIISVSARNVDDKLVESSYEITYEQPDSTNIGFDNPSDVDVNIPKTESTNHDAIAVVIGNRDYQLGDAPDVDYAVRDAIAMREYLINTMGFKSGNIHLLENATYGHLITWFGSWDDWKGNLYDKIKPEKSDIFIYYTGHGAPGPEGERYGYIVPSDCDPKKVTLNGYPLQVLFDNLSRLSCRNLTVVIDACFSGGSAAGQLIPNVSAIVVKGSAMLAKGNAVLFTSSSGKEVSTWYEDKRHSLFTYFFLKGLRGTADNNGDKLVTVGELENYLTDKTGGVPYYSQSINHLPQSPQVHAVDKSKVLVDLR
jgi:hypothetical protein